MRPGTTVNISITLPKPMMEAVERLCKKQARNRSELIREALRRYITSAADAQEPDFGDDEPVKPALATFTEWSSESDKAYDVLSK